MEWNVYASTLRWPVSRSQAAGEQNFVRATENQGDGPLQIWAVAVLYHPQEAPLIPLRSYYRLGTAHHH